MASRKAASKDAPAVSPEPEQATELPEVDPEKLEGVLRTLRQGDVISLGAVAIVGTHSSQVIAAAGDPRAGEPDASALVASVTIESASGWYVILSQDCDIVRSVDVEPCLQVSPVVYVEDAIWDRLRAGQTSYRQFAVPDGRLKPLAPADAALAEGRKPVVDLRYVTSVDKTALLTVPKVQRLTPLGPTDRPRFGRWVGSRFDRLPFEDRVVEDVLPPARSVLDSLFKQRTKQAAGGRKPAVAFVGCMSEWYVRQMERNIEIMGRLDLALVREERLVKTVAGEPVLNEATLDAGAKAMRAAIVAKLPKDAGYAVSVTWQNFDELSASQAETYALWVVQDDPEASATRYA